jgi:hypothetical protein
MLAAVAALLPNVTLPTTALLRAQRRLMRLLRSLAAASSPLPWSRKRSWNLALPPVQG